LRGAARELPAADAHAGAAVERAEDHDVLRVSAGYRHRGEAHHVAGRLPAVLELHHPAQLGQAERSAQGAAGHRVVEHHVAADAVDLLDRQPGVVDRLERGLAGEREHAAPGIFRERGVADSGDRNLTHNASWGFAKFNHH
jgi:hypothetical protein